MATDKQTGLDETNRYEHNWFGGTDPNLLNLNSIIENTGGSAAKQNKK